jgi:hypothetical protein
MAEHDDLVKELAAANTAATFQNLALIGALAERRLVDPANVADWAEFLATEMENSADSANPEHLQKIAARLRDYSRQLMNIVEPPEAQGESGLKRNWPNCIDVQSEADCGKLRTRLNYILLLSGR